MWRLVSSQFVGKKCCCHANEWAQTTRAPHKYVSSVLWFSHSGFSISSGYRPEIKPTTFSPPGELYGLSHSCRDSAKWNEMKEKSRKGSQSQLGQKYYHGYSGAIRTEEISQQEFSWFHLETKACAGHFSKCAALSLKREKKGEMRFHRWLFRTVTEVVVQSSMALLSFLIMYLSLCPTDYGHWALSLNRFTPEKKKVCMCVCASLPLLPLTSAPAKSLLSGCLPPTRLPDTWQSLSPFYPQEWKQFKKKHASAEVVRVSVRQERKIITLNEFSTKATQQEDAWRSEARPAFLNHLRLPVCCSLNEPCCMMQSFLMCAAKL